MRKISFTIILTSNILLSYFSISDAYEDDDAGNLLITG
jgi:hypothetical protein